MLPYQRTMSDLLALDVALLPPTAISDIAARASEGLATGSQGDRLVLDAHHLPHITLTQQFVRVDEIVPACERIDEVLRHEQPLEITVTGSVKHGHSIWMTVKRTDALATLHERLMEGLRGYERSGGTAAAFFEHDARVADVIWVAGYRLKSSFGAFTPHVTLGAGDVPPAIAPTTFQAGTVAACHLGRYCSCRSVLRRWKL